MAKEELNKIKKPTGLQPIDYSKAYTYKPLTPDIEAVVNFKFLEEFGKEIQDSIIKL